MEKITKEELMENLGWTPLSDDEFAQVTGGNATPIESTDKASFEEHN